jgi:hypothetical protein
LIFSGRVNGTGYSANIFYLGHFFYRYEIQIALAKRVTVRLCIGKISSAGYFKGRSRIPINNRAQTERKNAKKCEAFCHCDHSPKGRRDLHYPSETGVVAAIAFR